MTKENRGGARVGAGRPKVTNKKQTLGTSVHPDAKARLKDLSDTYDLSQAEILEALLDRGEDIIKEIAGKRKTA